MLCIYLVRGRCIIDSNEKSFPIFEKKTQINNFTAKSLHEINLEK